MLACLADASPAVRIDLHQLQVADPALVPVVLKLVLGSASGCLPSLHVCCQPAGYSVCLNLFACTSGWLQGPQTICAPVMVMVRRTHS
jgi:hypothetical protein